MNVSANFNARGSGAPVSGVLGNFNARQEPAAAYVAHVRQATQAGQLRLEHAALLGAALDQPRAPRR